MIFYSAALRIENARTLLQIFWLDSLFANIENLGIAKGLQYLASAEQDLYECNRHVRKIERASLLSGDCIDVRFGNAANCFLRYFLH